MSEGTLAIPTQASSNPSGIPERILIIADEAAIRESLETLLTLEGFVVEMAVNGEAGLLAIERNAYDLVLLDLALPGKNGMEILAIIRDLHAVILGIMITAY